MNIRKSFVFKSALPWLTVCLWTVLAPSPVLGEPSLLEILLNVEESVLTGSRVAPRVPSEMNLWYFQSLKELRPGGISPTGEQGFVWLARQPFYGEGAAYAVPEELLIKLGARVDGNYMVIPSAVPAEYAAIGYVTADGKRFLPIDGQVGAEFQRMRENCNTRMRRRPAYSPRRRGFLTIFPRSMARTANTISFISAPHEEAVSLAMTRMWGMRAIPAGFAASSFFVTLAPNDPGTVGAIDTAEDKWLRKRQFEITWKREIDALIDRMLPQMGEIARKRAEWIQHELSRDPCDSDLFRTHMDLFKRANYLFPYPQDRYSGLLYQLHEYASPNQINELVRRTNFPFHYFTP